MYLGVGAASNSAMAHNPSLSSLNHVVINEDIDFTRNQRMGSFGAAKTRNINLVTQSGHNESLLSVTMAKPQSR
jgi:hypothetical protein